MRGQGIARKPALLRVDGAGKIEVVSFENLKHTKVTLPNAPNAGTNPQRDPHQQSITDMAFSDGRLYIAGLSNEEFASKLRSVKYPSRPPTTAPPSRFSRQSRPARNALARLRVPAVFDQQRAAPRGRVSVHAAGEVSGGHASARNQGRRHDHRRTRQPQPADRHGHGALQEGRP
jgi:hypothetical protein